MPHSKRLCHKVKVKLEDSRIIVFKKGTENGGMGWIPTGGKHSPRKEEEESPFTKKVQKKDRKKQTSDKIKRIIPNLILSSIFIYSHPIKNSLVKEKNHKKIIKIKIKKLKKSGQIIP